MSAFQLESLTYQTEAVTAVVDVFAGTPKTPEYESSGNQLYRACDQQTPPRKAIVCFDSKLETITLEWLRQQKGQCVIVLEAALDTTGKWNLHHQLGDGLVVFKT